jgi:hypothetical protein
MVKALMKLADRTAGLLLPEVKASASCTPATYTSCTCDHNNGTRAPWLDCTVYHVAGNCASSTTYYNGGAC